MQALLTCLVSSGSQNLDLLTHLLPWPIHQFIWQSRAECPETAFGVQAPTCQAGSVRAETAATPEQLQQQAVNQRQQALQLQQDTVDRLLAAEASLAEDEAGVTPPEAQQR